MDRGNKMSNHVIELEHVSMMFNKSSEKVDNIKEYIIKFLKRELRFEEFWALNDVNIKIEKGESVAFIGLNGSGKSTLLKNIAGVLKPTKGNIKVYGSVAPLIELGAGFDPDLSARENVYLNGAVLGYDRRSMDNLFHNIIDFAELWEFVDVPIKNFSSGMQARLGFAIATSVIPEILIVDEVLGVGDYKFQEKCHKRMSEIIDSGATVLFVSHNIDQVKEICTRAIWLEKGKVIMDGEVNEVCERYMEQ